MRALVRVIRAIHEYRRGVGVLVAAAALACGGSERGDTRSAAVQAAALTELFLVRERASALVLWHDSANVGPIFDSLGLTPARDVSAPTALPVTRLSLRDLEGLFQDNPDGWAALYARYPGTPGLVEVSEVRFRDETAEVDIGRSCGENCRMGWTLMLTRSSGGAGGADAGAGAGASASADAAAAPGADAPAIDGEWSVRSVSAIAPR